MKRYLALCLLAILACGENEAPEQAAADMGPDTLPASIPAPEVDGGYLIATPEQVRGWQEADESVVILDARDATQYGREHIPGAVNVSYADIRAGANLPAREARVVIYCSDKDCPISQYAYEALRLLGYTDLYDMRAGIAGWKDAGYPTVVGGEATQS